MLDDFLLRFYYHIALYCTKMELMTYLNISTQAVPNFKQKISYGR